MYVTDTCQKVSKMIDRCSSPPLVQRSDSPERPAGLPSVSELSHLYWTPTTHTAITLHEPLPDTIKDTEVCGAVYLVLLCEPPAVFLLDVTAQLSCSGVQELPLIFCFLQLTLQPGDCGLLFHQLSKHMHRNRDAKFLNIGQVASCWSVDVFIDVQIMEAGEGVAGGVLMRISLKLSPSLIQTCLLLFLHNTLHCTRLFQLSSRLLDNQSIKLEQN